MLPLPFALPTKTHPPSLGILSDTHSLLRPEALHALAGVQHILHAGDAGSEQVLRQLEELAPVTVVRGNIDKDSWASDLPVSASVRLGGVGFYLIHDRADLGRHPPPSNTSVVIYGHSHQPSLARTNDIFYLNPGSAGPRRFRLPVTLVQALPQGRLWHFRFVNLVDNK